MRSSIGFGLAVVLSLLGIQACGGSDGASGAPSTSNDADSSTDAQPEPNDAADAGQDALQDAQANDAQEAGPDGSAPDSGGDADPDAGCTGTPAQCAHEAEARTADRLGLIEDDESQLTAFLRDMPKGGDLHHHLSGAVYAETMLDWAQTEGGYCIVSSSLSLGTSCGSSTTQPIPNPGDALYDKVIGAWSMEGFVPSATQSGHDHFFATFGKYGAISGTHHGKMLADVMQRAASENELYIELMLTSNSTAQTLGQNEWSAHHDSASLTAADLPTFYGELEASSGLAGAVQAVLTDVSQSETQARQILGCDSAQPMPGCSVSTRYMTYISRSGATPGVFAQMVASYEAAIQDPRLVALNLVGPEDNTGALSRYDVEMAMLGFLYSTYRVTNLSPLHVSLHAGELAAAYMPSSYDIGTIDHVRKAVQIAHAERIGHGVDALQESDPQGLLQQLKQNNVLVEICLSSNAQILEVSGSHHPLGDFIGYGVPVALATDDQAVSRSSMAGEELRAVQDQQLGYLQLKRMARDSLEHAFVPGASLWQSPDTAVPDCDPDTTGYLGQDPPPAACAAFLATSERAKLQWELEQRFHAFEAAQ